MPSHPMCSVTVSLSILKTFYLGSVHVECSLDICVPTQRVTTGPAANISLCSQSDDV